MKNISILIVEDEAIIAENLARSIHKMGYSVAGITATGEGAIELACQKRPALVLMDIRLAGAMDGIVAAQQIHRDYNLPTLFLSANSDIATVKRTRLEGAFGYILKPFDNRDLEIQIEMALYKHTTQQRLRQSEENLRKYSLELQREIAERKQVEEALKNREYLLNKVFDVLPIGLWFADENGKLIRGNPAGVKIWGAEPTVPIEEYGVFKARRLPSGKEIAPDDSALAHTIREGVTIVDELLEIDSFDGKKKIILNYTAPVLDDRGNIQGAIVVNHDITEREQLHAQLQQAQKMESVGRLAGGVAHDSNNMLGVIFGHTEMALEDLDPAAPLHASLQAVQHAAERSAALTRQLLAFARKQTIAPKVIDINDTVEGMLKMLRRLIGEDIDLLWQPGRNLQSVKVDPSQIDQLLANLCVNARDAIAGVGKVTIETDAKTLDEVYCADHLGVLPGEYVLLAVSDDGCGMNKKTLNHIFEPFFTTKGEGKGTGLGLASVFGMVKQNNGFINVYSEPGKGTTFKIYLPVYAVKSVGVVAKAPDLPAEHGNETILLVEDEPAILHMTTMMLTRLGYTVVAAATPGEAIRLALEYPGRIDLLMTDVVMPEMNGRELAGNLLSQLPGLKHLFMSGYTANVIAHHGVLDEGVHFIQKPFSMKDLGGKLREALEG